MEMTNIGKIEMKNKMLNELDSTERELIELENTKEIVKNQIDNITKTEWLVYSKEQKENITKTFNDYAELEAKESNKDNPGFIAYIAPKYELTTIEQDELNFSYEQVGSNQILLFPDIYDDKKVNEKDYKFKVGLNVSGNYTILRKDLTKEDIDKGVLIEVP